jgi:hypothetical protein
MREGEDRRVASALFRARLVDEPTLRALLSSCKPGTLADTLIESGRLKREDLDRALLRIGSSSGRWPTLPQMVPDVPIAPAGSAIIVLRTAKPGDVLPPGTRLGGYTLKKLLARGGMGAVFTAEQGTIGRTVALKTLLAGEQASEEQLARFLIEAKAAARVAHANIVPVYDVGEAEGVRYLTMELVDGPSLGKILKQGPLEPRRALAIVEGVARGVAAAHGAGIIHRDLKPDNVLVAPGDVPKVMDFGLAKEASADVGLTASGAILGTPQYMAPEQAAGEAVGALADVYGLGAILYECLVGKAPYEGTSIANILTKIFNSEIVPPRQIRPTLSRDVDTICMKALERAPERRYESAAAFADDIGRWLKGDAIMARPAPTLERIRRRVRRHLGAFVAGTIGFVALVGVVLWFTVLADVRARSSREGEVRRFEALVDAEVGHVHENPDDFEASVARVDSARKTLLAAWEHVPRESWPEALSKHTASARLFAEAGERLGRSDLLARAYATEPSTKPGLLALARVMSEREGPATAERIDTVLRFPLPAPVVARLRLKRALLDLELLDIPRAAAMLEAVAKDPEAEPAVVASATFYLGGLAPIARSRDVPLPFPSREVQVLVLPGEKRARLAALDPNGQVEVATIDRGKWVKTHHAPAPRREPEAQVDGLTCTVRGDDVYGAYYYRIGDKFRLDLTKNGSVFASIPKNSMLGTRGLRFLDLGDGGGLALLCNVGPNDGDSMVVRIDASDHATSELLDRNFGTSNASTYIASFATADVDGPLLLLGYSAWRGYRIRGFRPSATGLSQVMETPRLGIVDALELPGGRSLVAAIGHDEDPEAKDEGPSVVMFDVAADGLTERARFPAIRSEDARGARVERLVSYRRKEGSFALWSAGTRPPSQRLRLARLTKPTTTFVDILSRASGGIWGTGDLDGEGEDALVLAGPNDTVRLLGIRDGEPAPPPAAAPAPGKGEAIVAADLLRKLNDFPREALTAVERRQEELGAVTPDTESLELSILENEAARGGAAFEVASAKALDKSKGTSETFRARVHLLRAEWFSEQEATAALAAAELDAATLGADASKDDRRRHERVARTLDLRGVRPMYHTQLEYVLRGEQGQEWPEKNVREHLLASDPVRVRLDRERGLVARVDRRVRFMAGFPIDVPSGTTRIVVDFKAGLPAWGAKVALGLFREVGAGVAPDPLELEGLLTGINLWQVASPLDQSRILSAGFGRRDSGSEAQRGLTRVPGSEEVAKPFLTLEHAFLLHLRVIMEHDAPTRWSRWRLDDLETGKTLVDQQGTAAIELPTGPYLFGVCSLGENGTDLAGGGTWQPDIDVAIERLRLDHAPSSRTVPRSATQIEKPPSTEERRKVYGRFLVLRDKPSGLTDQTVRTLSEIARTAPPAERPKVLVQLAATAASVGDDELARAFLAAAIEDDPLGLLRALEDDGRDLDDKSAAQVRHAIAAALAASTENTEKALLRRAVLHRLRGEIRECLECADKLPPGEARAYVRLSAQLRQDFKDEYGAVRTRATLPEVVYPLRCFWEPPPVPDVESALKERYEQARAAEKDGSDHGSLVWLDRWIELAPGRTDLLLERALRTSQIPNGAVRAALAWRVSRDLGRILELEPGNANAAFNLGILELQAWNFVAAKAHLGKARQLGHDSAVRAQLEPLKNDPKTPERVKQAIEEILK